MSSATFRMAPKVKLDTALPEKKEPIAPIGAIKTTNQSPKQRQVSTYRPRAHPNGPTCRCCRRRRRPADGARCQQSHEAIAPRAMAGPTTLRRGTKGWRHRAMLAVAPLELLSVQEQREERDDHERQDEGLAKVWKAKVASDSPRMRFKVMTSEAEMRSSPTTPAPQRRAATCS